jgi:hypothetical protein
MAPQSADPPDYSRDIQKSTRRSVRKIILYSSADVYECLPFILPYDALSVGVTVFYKVSGRSATRKLSFFKMVSEKSPVVSSPL